MERNTNQQTTLDRIKDGLKYLGISRNAVGEWLQGEMLLTEKQTATKLELWIRDVERGESCAVTRMCGYLELLRVEHRHAAFLETKESIKFSPQATAAMEELIAIICGTNLSEKQRRFYAPTLAHSLWNCKRSLYGLKRDNPILLSFFGHGGSGKNEFLKRLFSPLDRQLWVEVSHAGNLFKDPREQMAFAEKYAMILPELSGMKSTDITYVKSIIDNEEIFIRNMTTNDFTRRTNRATLVGSSNEHLSTIMSAELNMRKMAEIEFAFYDTIEERSKLMFEPINNFDFLNLWRSIDENGLSPIAHFYSEWTKWTQSVCLKHTPTQLWFAEFMQLHAGAAMAFSDIRQHYDRYVRANDIKPEFVKKDKGLAEFLQGQNCAKKRTNTSRLYIIPSRENAYALIGSEDDCSDPAALVLSKEEE